MFDCYNAPWRTWPKPSVPPGWPVTGFFFSSRRRHTRSKRDWSSDVCSSDLRQLGTWVHEQGIPRVKIKIGANWGAEEDRDLERIALARKAIGDRAELFVDANGAYGRKQAVRLRSEERRVGKGRRTRWLA